MKERLLAAAGPLLGVALFGLAIAILHHELAAYHYHDVLEHLSAISRGEHRTRARPHGGGLSLAHGLRRARLPLDPAFARLLAHRAGVVHRVRVQPQRGPLVLRRERGPLPDVHELGRHAGRAGADHPLQRDHVLARLPRARAASCSIAAPLRLPARMASADRDEPPARHRASSPRSRSTSRRASGAIARCRLRGFEIALPGPGTTAAQIALSSIDWALAAGVFYALLPPAAGPLVRSRARRVPAGAGRRRGEPRARPGLGVFETMMVLLLAPWLPGDAVLGSALAYRLVYYLLPLAVAVVLFAGFELRERREVAAARRRRARAVGAGAGAARVHDHDLRGRRRAAALGRHAGGRRPRASCSSSCCRCPCSRCRTSSRASSGWRCCCWRARSSSASTPATC